MYLTLASTFCGFLAPQTLDKPSCILLKYPYPWKGYRFALGKVQGQCESTYRLPAPITSDHPCNLLTLNDIIKALSRHILSGFNRLDFLYNIHVSYWTPGEYPHTLGTPPKCMSSSSLGRWNGPWWWSEDDIGGSTSRGLYCIYL